MTWLAYIREYGTYVKRVFVISFEFLWNLRFLLRVPHPIVTIFGSSELDINSTYASQAYDLAHLLAQHDISVITGGGPGIMFSANCGAARVELDQHKKITKSLGIHVRGVDDDIPASVIPFIRFRYFFMRKWFLTQFSSVIVVFPGGIGTLDELFDVLNLRKHSMLSASVVVLIGAEYWNPLVTWLRDFGVARGIIRPDIVDLFKVTDNLQEVFNLVHIHCKGHAPNE
jgi:uncharacterized protein (TIGR00730 family)